jgi:acetyltransferase-like isoleucine patch superfamily enzyme
MKLQEILSDSERTGLQKYRALVMGDRSTAAFLAYELFTTAFGWIPGGLGYFLRKATYPRLFRETGRGVVFGRDVVLRYPHRIRLGNHVAVDDNCLLDARGGGENGIRVGDHTIISRNTTVLAKFAPLTIGEHTNIGSGCLISSMDGLSIGNRVLIAANCYIGGGTYVSERTDIAIVDQGYLMKGPVIIGDNCWLGAGVAVLDGVKIGRDCIVGAGAVVTRDLPDFAVAAGVPARVLRIRGEYEACPDT